MAASTDTVKSDGRYAHFTEQDWRILRDRAQRAAKSSKHQEGEILTALQIYVGGESYALPIDNLRTVYENVTVKPVPCVPAFVAGIANIRGRITPVLDLSVLLHAQTNHEQSKFTLVVAENEEITVALQVQSVGEVTTLPVNSLAPVPANIDETQKTYLQGILRDGSGLLEIDALLADPALIISETVS